MKCRPMPNQARCRHNLNYWDLATTWASAPAAHGKLSFHDRIVREARCAIQVDAGSHGARR